MKKRIITILSAICILGTTLYGCKGQEKEPVSSTSTNTENTNSDTVESSEPKEFSVFLFLSGTPFNNKWEVWQEIAQKTNITLNSVVASSNSDEETAYQTMLVSGDLADIIGYKHVKDMEKLGHDGGLLALNDLIDEHAPNIKKALETDSAFAKSATALNGDIYQIPLGRELVCEEFWWIRKDWLDKLELEVPTTIDEYYNVLTAFRNNDPNGNGIKDEVPIFDRSNDWDYGEYLALWDSSHTFYPRDGVITYEPYTENYKYAVSQMAKWYKEELIDPELFTRGMAARDTLFSGDLGGSTHDWVSTGSYNNSLKEVIEGFEVIPIAPLKNQNNEIIERRRRYPGAGWGISSQCSDPVAVIKFMDYMFTEEGYRYMNFGIEGKTYTIDENGEYKFTDEVMNSELAPVEYLRSLGAQYRAGYIQSAAYEFATMDESGILANEMYTSNQDWYSKSNIEPLKLTEEDEAEYTNIMASVKPYMEEKFQSWVLGIGDVEKEFDAYKQELEARGIERAIEIMNKSYQISLEADK